MSSINYHGYHFSSPVPYRGVETPRGGGVYAIQVPNALWTPTTLQPIYFGQTHDFYERHVREQHPAFVRWVGHPGSMNGLFISFYPMPYANQSEREFTESVLVSYYRPTCNWSQRDYDRWMTLGGLFETSQDREEPALGLLGFDAR
jgi:hypothetical protein